MVILTELHEGCDMWSRIFFCNNNVRAHRIIQCAHVTHLFVVFVNLYFCNLWFCVRTENVLQKIRRTRSQTINFLVIVSNGLNSLWWCVFHPCWLCHTHPDFCFYDNERGKIDTLMLSIRIHDCSLSCLGTDTSMISGRVKLVAVMQVLPRVGKVLKYLGEHQYYKKTAIHVYNLEHYAYS